MFLIRAELEANYAKGLSKLSGKLTKACAKDQGKYNNDFLSWKHTHTFAHVYYYIIRVIILIVLKVINLNTSKNTLYYRRQ